MSQDKQTWSPRPEDVKAALARLTTAHHPIGDGNAPFYEDPSDMAAHLETVIMNGEEGSPMLLEKTVSFIESEAIARFAKQTGTPERMTPAEKRADRLLWVARWVAEAEAKAKFPEALTPIARSAARVLFACAKLRLAIERQEHLEQVAARAMLLLCELFMGGSAWDGYVVATAAVQQRETRLRNTIGADHSDLERARNACITLAGNTWKKEPARRMGDVAKACRNMLIEHRDKLPTLKSFPTEVTIRGWLKHAERDGKLSIPGDASKPGRNRG